MLQVISLLATKSWTRYHHVFLLWINMNYMIFHLRWFKYRLKNLFEYLSLRVRHKILQASRAKILNQCYMKPVQKFLISFIYLGCGRLGCSRWIFFRYICQNLVKTALRCHHFGSRSESERRCSWDFWTYFFINFAKWNLKVRKNWERVDRIDLLKVPVKAEIHKPLLLWSL